MIILLVYLYGSSLNTTQTSFKWFKRLDCISTSRGDVKIINFYLVFGGPTSGGGCTYFSFQFGFYLNQTPSKRKVNKLNNDCLFTLFWELVVGSLRTIFFNVNVDPYFTNVLHNYTVADSKNAFSVLLLWYLQIYTYMHLIFTKHYLILQFCVH